ncbi:CRISPR-associated protein Csx20 [Fusobacterium sp. PH5-44]|uniref:CRISPR-associated protein Csx20 n=1 Tax=unclassified Fusobacterium TaxID=2648384 RepID=UPI003D1E2998
MAKILIATLGTGKKDGNGNYARVYQEANYKIEDKIYKNKQYIAMALEDHFNIDKVFYIGTLGSMWENVYAHYCEKSDKNKNEEYMNEELFGKIANFFSFTQEEQQSKPLDWIDMKEFINYFDGKVVPVVTRYGLNDEENYENFDKILEIINSLNDGDELYLDITHSFRSNAFWIFLVLNYINDVLDSKVKIKYISYGMFEARYKSENGTELVPVIDLQIFFTLMKWIKGANSFSNFGNVDLIEELLKEDKRNEDIKIKDGLKKLSDALSMNYVTEIKNTLEELRRNMKKIELMEGPAKAIIPKVIRKFLDYFSGVKENYEILLRLSEWHYEEKRYGIAYVNLIEALREFIFVNYAIKKGKIEAKKSISETEKQGYISSWKGLVEITIVRNKNLIKNDNERKILEFYHLYDDCRKVRNGLAHSVDGFKNSKKDIELLFDRLVKAKKFFKNNEFMINVNFNMKKEDKVARKAFILFSHVLTDMQKKELKEEFHCAEILYLPENLQRKWSNIEGEDRSVFFKYLKENCNKGDYVLVQGEWGLTYSIVAFCKKEEYIPIYAATARNVIEKKDGEKIYKTSVFEHIKFRKY